MTPSDTLDKAGERCAHCRFWDKREPQFIYADCRRGPPQSQLSVDIRKPSYGEGPINVTVSRFPHAAWPNTSQDDWCGEFSPAPPSDHA